MLRPRIIPCLLIQNGGLVKTVGFSKPKYVGDPINAVRIFNEKEVDELVVLDIDATAKGREPDYNLIEKLAAECRMPLCYGGGVCSTRQAERIISMGVEKVALSAAATQQPELVSSLAEIVGAQSVVVVMDIKRAGLRRRYEVFTVNGTQRTGVTPAGFAVRMQELGAGEIVINSIDRDGTMSGFDHELIAMVRAAVSVPVTALGGAGSLKDIQELIDRFGILGVSAGSLFVFKGKYRAVLINYPDRSQKDALFRQAATD